MRRSRPLLAFALCVAPLLLAAQTPDRKGATAPAANAADAATPPAPERAHARGTKSLMGMVMAALIASAEQSARQRAAPLPQVAPDQATPPAKTRAVLHRDALREDKRNEIAARADGG